MLSRDSGVIDMVFELELACPHPEWRRYNIFLTLAGYDAEGRQVDLQTFTDKLHDVFGGAEPVRRRHERPAKVSCGPCFRAVAYVNAVAGILPGQHDVSRSPDFEAVVTARADGAELWRKTVMVNGWGGLSIAGLEIRPDSSTLR